MSPFKVTILISVLYNRYHWLEYNPETKAMKGIQRDKVNYISYDFKNKDINLSNLINEKPF